MRKKTSGRCVCICVCVRGGEVGWGELRKAEGIGRQRWGICNPRQTACHSWYSQGAHTQAEEIRCQFKTGQLAKLQVSHYKMRGHLKTQRIFFLPVLFSNALNHACLARPLSFSFGLVFITQTVCVQRRRSGGWYMIVPFEAYCSWHLETWFKLRLQIGSPSWGFLITNLIYPISWGCLPCKSRKVHISTLIKPSFSDDSRAEDKWLLSKSSGMPQPLQPSHSDFEYSDKMGLSAFEPGLIQGLVRDQAQTQLLRWKGFPSTSQTAERWRYITRQKVIEFVLPLTHANLVWGQHRIFRCKVDFFSPICTWSCIYFSLKVSGEKPAHICCGLQNGT